jgi:hypothetical protein
MNKTDMDKVTASLGRHLAAMAATADGLETTDLWERYLDEELYVCFFFGRGPANLVRRQYGLTKLKEAPKGTLHVGTRETA